MVLLSDIMDINEIRKYHDLISGFYGDKCAKRSGVPLMNHINEGLVVLDAMSASIQTKAAYCIHPMFQGPENYPDIYHNPIIYDIDPQILMLVMEYRKTANAFLCKPHTDYYSVDNLEIYCPLNLFEVREMLMADKVQNRKDFEIYHMGTHDRSDQLHAYFHTWLRYLGITEDQYHRFVKLIDDYKKEVHE